jgi:hypothetical protein
LLQKGDAWKEYARGARSLKDAIRKLTGARVRGASAVAKKR